MNDDEYIKIVEEYKELSNQILYEMDIEKRKLVRTKMKELNKIIQDQEVQMEIEEFLDEMRSKGAISLKDQEIKIHKNGAKITIPQTYLKDGMLSDKVKYNIIFVPLP
jgi:uncharacterized protein (DUF2235 family)